MSIWFIKPGVNDNYAHYLVGLGGGIVLGAVSGYSSTTFPKFIVGVGALFLIVGSVVSVKAIKNGKK